MKIYFCSEILQQIKIILMHLNRISRCHEKKITKELESDVIAENYHLKSEIIKARKSLKSYEDKMFQCFQKWSKELQLAHQTGFIFDTPLQELTFFQTLIERAVLQKKESEKKSFEAEGERIKIRKEYEKQNSANRQLKKDNDLLKSQNEKNLKIICDHQVEKKEMQAKYQKLFEQKLYCDNQIEKILNQQSIKLLEERKALHEKAKQQIANLRVQMLYDFSEKEKQLRQKIVEKDIQISDLKNKMRNQFKQLEEREHTELEASLLQKLQSSVKQNSEMKKVHQELTMQLHGITSKLQYLQNELSLVNFRLKDKSRENEIAKTAVNQLQQELKKVKQDNKSLQRYYEEKWISQFSNVKSNLQKQLKEKQAELQKKQSQIERRETDMYAKLQIINNTLHTEREKMNRQIMATKEQNETLRKLKKKLTYEISVLKYQKETTEKKCVQNLHRLRQIQLMANEEAQSLKEHHRSSVIQMEGRLKKVEIEKFEVEKETYQEKKEFIKQIEVIKVKYEQQIKMKIKQMEKIGKERLSEKQKEIQEQKMSVEMFKKQQTQKATAFQEKLERGKDRLIKQLKNSHQEEVNRLINKLKRQQEKANIMKKEILQKDVLLTSVTNEKENISNGLNMRIEKLENKILEIQKKNRQVLSENYQKIDENKQKQQIINNLQCEIRNLQSNLQKLESELAKTLCQKEQWKQKLQACRQEYQSGFQALKTIHQKKVEHFRSRIWELEQIYSRRRISKKDYQKIRSLTEEKIKLQNDLAFKQAENIAITKTKQYYEYKSKSLNQKMITQCVMKNNSSNEIMQSVSRITKPQQMKQKIQGQQNNDDEPIEIVKGRKKNFFHHSQLIGQMKNKDRTSRNFQTNRNKSQIQSKCTSRINYSVV